jgi:uncharacterized protein (DUF58 family)
LDLYNLRLYQPGDDSRRIHWMSTARTSQLIVRETEAETQDMATVYLSVFAPAWAHERFEQAVELTASIVAHLLEQGFRTRLVVGESAAQSDTDDADLRRVLAPLSTCRPHEAPGDGTLPLAPPAEELCGDDRGPMIVILPWSTEDLRRRFDRATHLIDLGDTEYGDVLNGSAARIPA